MTTIVVPKAGRDTLGMPDTPVAAFLDPPGGGSSTGNGWTAWCIRRGDQVIHAATVNLHAGYIAAGEAGAAAQARKAADLFNAALDEHVPDVDVLIGVEGVRRSSKTVPVEQWQPQAWFVEAFVAEFDGCQIVEPSALGQRHKQLGGKLEDHYPRDVWATVGRRLPWINEHPRNDWGHIRAAFDGAGELIREWHS